jgi:hypothetical protein
MRLVRQLPRLRELDISYIKIEAEVLASLERAPDSEGLTTLRLRACRLGDSCIEVLSRSKHAPSLTTLDLAHNYFTWKGAMALVESTRLSRLRRLNLTRCSVGPDVGRRLRDRFGDGLILCHRFAQADRGNGNPL